MKLVLAIAAGGALGAVLRHFVNNSATHLFGTGFPWGIFIANILGSFAMGCIIAYAAHIAEPPQAVKAFITVGLLGAFTTFSTFSLDSVLLIQRGELLAATVYIAGSVLLAIGGLVAGMSLVRMFA